MCQRCKGVEILVDVKVETASDCNVVSTSCFNVDSKSGVTFKMTSAINVLKTLNYCLIWKLKQRPIPTLFQSEALLLEQ